MGDMLCASGCGHIIASYREVEGSTPGDRPAVIEALAHGELPPGRCLFYLDSEGEPGALLVADGRFAGFAPWDGCPPAPWEGEASE